VIGLLPAGSDLLFFSCRGFHVERLLIHNMKRTYFPGITDIVVVTDPEEIRTISNDARFDRDFILHGPVRNVQRLRKMLRIFSLNGRLFEPMLPRTDPSRADSIQNYPRYVRRTQNVLPENEYKSPSRIAIDLRAAREVRLEALAIKYRCIPTS